MVLECMQNIDVHLWSLKRNTSNNPSGLYNSLHTKRYFI